MAGNPSENQHARSFTVDELFFSTTDTKGFIQAGNEVFVRVSGYTADELLGKPHNVIRHRHTPRVVFRLLWQELAAGNPIVAYVKNQAKDGAHYWVLAAVRPIDGGYLSVRLKPTSPLFDTIQKVYAELHGIESEIEQSGGSRSDAMEASAIRFEEVLATLGMADYQAFMRTALAAEVLARRAAVGVPLGGDSGTGGGALGIARRLGQRLNAELDSVEGYMSVNQALAERSAALVRLAEEGQVLALNAVLAARRLGDDGGPLVAVASLMQQTFPEVVKRARSVVERIEVTRTALQQLGFEVALAVLQNDMSTTFLGEVVHRHEPAEAASLTLLIDCLRSDVNDVLDTVRTVAQGLTAVSSVADDLIRNLGQLAAIERNGRIEATRTSGAEAFRSLLDNTRERVTSAQAEIRYVSTLASSLDLRHVSLLQRAFGAELEQLRDAVDAMMDTIYVPRHSEHYQPAPVDLHHVAVA